MKKTCVFLLIAPLLICACSNPQNDKIEFIEETSGVEVSNVEVEETEPVAPKIGPDNGTWVQIQYANADYDYKSITNGERFAIIDGVTLIDDMISNIHTLEGIINDNGFKISQFPDFYKTPTMADKLNRNHKAAKKELQKRLPEYRKYYVKTARNILWKHDIKVKSTGTTIWFIGAIFARNANIQEFNDDQCSKLRTLGFKRACYKWVDADVEYTYYDL
jgi:hypothetical protein